MWLAAGSGSEALGLKKFVFVVLMLLVGAGWAGFHAPELLPQAQRLADDALSHFERDDGAIHVEGSGAALPDVKKAASAFDGLTQEKLGRASPWKIMPTSAATGLIVPDSLAPEVLAPYRELDVEITEA